MVVYTTGLGEVYSPTEAAGVEAWVAAGSDLDADGFSGRIEFSVGTDRGDDCPDDPSDDALPVDFDNDTLITSAARAGRPSRIMRAVHAV